MASVTPIGFRIGERSITYRYDRGRVSVSEGLDGAASVIGLSPQAWEDVVSQLRTFINLYMARELHFERGDFSALVEWEPLLKFHHCGVPVYDPARADLVGFDLQRSFTSADTDDELRTFLAKVGYLHVRGVFEPGELAEMNTEVDRMAAEATPDDDRSWWVTDEGGDRRLCRLVYAGLRSPRLAAVESDPRVTRLGQLLRPDLRAATDRMEGTSVLLKVPGRTSGLSNIPWHQDCGIGGHAICCPSIAVGVQLTGSDAGSGNLLMVPGSHGQTLHYDWMSRYPEAPVVAINTEPGDVTVHVADVMHASPEPTGAGGRRTMYVTFFPPTLWDHVGPGRAFNDLIRHQGERAASLQRR